MMLFMPTFRWAKTVRISDLLVGVAALSVSEDLHLLPLLHREPPGHCKNLLAFLTRSTKLKNPMGHLLCLGPCHAQDLRLGVLAVDLPGQVNFALSTPLRAATGR